jgi:hypothetical protein
MGEILNVPKGGTLDNIDMIEKILFFMSNFKITTASDKNTLHVIDICPFDTVKRIIYPLFIFAV